MLAFRSIEMIKGSGGFLSSEMRFCHSLVVASAPDIISANALRSVSGAAVPLPSFKSAVDSGRIAISERPTSSAGISLALNTASAIILLSPISPVIMPQNPPGMPPEKVNLRSRFALAIASLSGRSIHNGNIELPVLKSTSSNISPNISPDSTALTHWPSVSILILATNVPLRLIACS